MPRSQARPPHVYKHRPKKIPAEIGIDRWRETLVHFDRELSGLDQSRQFVQAVHDHIDRDLQPEYLRWFSTHHYGLVAMVVVRRLHRPGRHEFNVTFTGLLDEIGRRPDLILAALSRPGEATEEEQEIDRLRDQISEDRRKLDEKCHRVSDFADGIAHVIPLEGGMGSVPADEVRAALYEMRRLCNGYGALVGLELPQHKDELAKFTANLREEFHRIFGGRTEVPAP